MIDHDQRFKAFLQHFLPEFFQQFLPEWASRFDFSRIEWLDQEVFPDPPEGARHVLDLVAKLHATEPIQDETGHASEDWLSLIHVEIESSDSVRPLRRRMHWYYSNLRQRHELPVLPVAVYMNVALSGLGIDEYQEDFGSLDVLRFRYLYVGLPGLDGIEYLQQGDEVSAALLSLMRVPIDQLPILAAEAARRIANSPRNQQEKYLLVEMLEAYLTEEQEQEYRQLVKTREEYREVNEMAVTTFERGVQQGREEERNQALQRQRDLTVAMIEKRFGSLTPDMQNRLEQLSFDQLVNLCLRMIDVQTVDELWNSGA